MDFNLGCSSFPNLPISEYVTVNVHFALVIACVGGKFLSEGGDLLLVRSHTHHMEQSALFL